MAGAQPGCHGRSTTGLPWQEHNRVAMAGTQPVCHGVPFNRLAPTITLHFQLV